jgi:hypothetical protein
MSINAGQFQMTRRIFRALLVITVATACSFAGAQQASPKGSASIEQPKGKAFAKPEDAAAAPYAAAHRDDEQALLVILGPDSKEVIAWSDDANVRREHRMRFTQKYEQMHRLVKEPDDTVALYVGAENWPLPIPLVEYKGSWYFDAEMGKQEIRYRRVGRNEMEALEVCRTLADAEKEYYGGAHHYTDKFVSTGGARDGLYWKVDEGAEKSPIGPYLAHAGVSGSAADTREPFHGYYYRVLMNGDDAGPGAFAILAYPAEYRSSGVMSFLLDSSGRAYEKDLGEKTDEVSRKIKSAHPDDSWKTVE